MRSQDGFSKRESSSRVVISITILVCRVGSLSVILRNFISFFVSGEEVWFSRRKRRLCSYTNFGLKILRIVTSRGRFQKVFNHFSLNSLIRKSGGQGVSSSQACFVDKMRNYPDTYEIMPIIEFQRNDSDSIPSSLFPS